MSPPRCPRCGALVPADAPMDLCPSCLMTSAATPSTDDGAVQPPRSDPESDSSDARSAGTLSPGQAFGPFTIDRELGRGGMGHVYAATDTDHERRVALKVLSHQLTGSSDRARFLREGQLAASINHPNTVYIFGAEEVDGVPVIAMEALPGETLRDQVTQRGPLPASEAVDAILQVIAGLDAAHTAGILHRDVKPSNCFVDVDGSIKVGDFGLSISTASRDAVSLTIPRALHGTPQFASPEQLRGHPLDIRADIYSVGATLYYLLSARPPFDHANLAVLITQVMVDRPTFPTPTARGVPQGLADVVLRCLAKDRRQRPSTYAELVDLLTPFSSSEATPASLEPRFAAAMFDVVILGAVVASVALAALATGWLTPESVPWIGLFGAAAFTHWTVVNGIWATSYGQRACGLRVVNAAGRPPGLARAGARSAMLLLPAAGIALAINTLEPTASPWPLSVRTLLSAAGLLIPFATARARNGWTGLHELVSGTRTVERTPPDDQRVLTAVDVPATPPRPHSALGPYTVLDSIGPTDSGELLLGIDPRLQRPVWLHITRQPVSGRRRDVSRRGRLRWLNGRDAGLQTWDAFEAVPGQPLLERCEQGHVDWSTLRAWLLDLATEIRDATVDRTLDGLVLDRIWVSPDGRARILDFRPPSTIDPGTSPTPTTLPSTQRWLHTVATTARRDARRAPLPLSATRFLDALGRAEFMGFDDLIRHLQQLSGRPDVVTHRHRQMALALCVASSVIGAFFLQPFVGPTLSWLVESELPRSLTEHSTGGYAGCAVLGLLSAVLFRGGFWLRVFRIAVVTADGGEVSRSRAAGRALLAWTWVPLQLIAAVPALGLLGLLGTVLKYGGLAWTADRSQRGPHDELLGTYLVPR